MSDTSSDDENELGLFKEPKDFYPARKSPTSTEYECQNGITINLRMVGHSPLWGHLLWNAGQVIATYLEENANTVVKDKTILELGAGAGLPSLVCAVLGASKVVVTDYPDVDLIENLQYNIDHCDALENKSVIVAEGFLWGNPIDPLKSHLSGDNSFDILILADILFNHSEHAKLVRTVKEALKPVITSRALVFFTPYRPWLFQNDLNFFELAKEAGFEVRKILEHVMEKVMFEEDRGDELLRRTVFGYELLYKG